MFDDRGGPSIDQVLTDFEREAALSRHPATARRFAAVRTRLRAYLATDAAHVLRPDEEVLLRAERQFTPDGAFARVFGVDVLLAALPGFVDPGWLPHRSDDARLQIRFIELLCDWTVTHDVVDPARVSGLVHGVREAARTARVRLRAAATLPGAATPAAGASGPVP